MALFRVELHRRAFRPGERHINPFLAAMPGADERVDMLVRQWEFEAENEAEVRRLLHEAYDSDLPGVRGYALRSIEQLSETASAKP